MTQSTPENDSSVSHYSLWCLVLSTGGYHKNNNSIHDILYTRHLDTYIYIVTWGFYLKIISTYKINLIYKMVIKNISPCVGNFKKVSRCLMWLLHTNMLPTTNHPTSLASGYMVSIVYHRVAGVWFCH